MDGWMDDDVWDVWMKREFGGKKNVPWKYDMRNQYLIIHH